MSKKSDSPIAALYIFMKLVIVKTSMMWNELKAFLHILVPFVKCSIMLRVGYLQITNISLKCILYTEIPLCCALRVANLRRTPIVTTATGTRPEKRKLICDGPGFLLCCFCRSSSFFST